MGWRIKKGDTVQVIGGKHKGEQGKVLEVLREQNRVRVEGVNVQKRHLKPGRNQKVPEGGIIDLFGPIHVSKVQPLDPQSGKPTRVGMKVLDAKGDEKPSRRRARVSRRSGEVLG